MSTEVTRDNFLDVVAETLDLDADIEEALKTQIQKKAEESEALRNEVRTLKQRTEELQKAAEEVPEQSGPAVDPERLKETLNSLVSAGMMRKEAAEKASENPSVLLDFLEKAAERTRKERVEMAAPQRGTESADAVGEADRAWEERARRLRQKLGR